MQETLVELQQLSKSYPGLDRPAVDRLSLTLRRGDVFGFVGPTGAGKTIFVSFEVEMTAEQLKAIGLDWLLRIEGDGREVLKYNDQYRR